jgi:integrase
VTPFKDKGMPTKHPGVFALGDGRWLVLKTWIDPTTGRRKWRRKKVKGTMDEALAVRAALRNQEPNAREQSRPRFNAFAANWLERAKSKIEPSTFSRYTVDVANLSVEFGDWWVDAIDHDAIEKWQAEMSVQYAAPTINGWHRTLRLILDRALRRRIVHTNAAREVSTLPEGRTKGARGTALSAEQVKAFIDAIPRCVRPEKKRGEKQPEGITADIARALYVFAWTGMRAGEIVALSWSDIRDGEISVEHSVWRGTKKSDKTDDPRRITVVSPLVAILEEQRRWLLTSQHPGLESGLVFPANPQQANAGASRRKGEVLWFRSQSTFQDAIAYVCKAAKVPRISPHALRRTFEDLTRQAGVEQLVRRAIHGWRSERAQGIYATVTRDERDAAASAVVRLVLG